MNSFMNENMLVVSRLGGAARWTSMRNDFVALFMMAFSSSFCIFYRDYTEPIYLAMLLVYILNIADITNSIFYFLMEFSRYIVSIKRCLQLFE